MNNSSELVPHKITKPIQLLAAWLAGLAIVNASFLTAAGLLHTPTWLPALLSIAAIVNVPVFIVSLFLLQTKFRPEMQEDTFYSRYLERRYAPITLNNNNIAPSISIDKLAEVIVQKVTANAPNKQEQVAALLKESEVEQLASTFRNSRTLSELYLHYDKWPELHEAWRENDTFQHDIMSLNASGLIHIPDGVVRNTTLSELGKAVASHLEAQKQLWNQINMRSMPRKEGK